MIIANPIYDVVFKRMMENERIARFFIGTLLDESIETIQIKPQEYTYEGEFDLNDPEAVKIIQQRIRERNTIWVYRLDFIATIKTAEGKHKKILIEIQKARNPVDVMRFRNYLADQYKREDTINNKQVALPITTIYILGFKLPEINTPCIKVDRQYKDLINNTILTQKSDFVEQLTHNSFVVQVERITGKYHTRLDKLLSVFEQRYFIDEKETIKEYDHPVDLEEMEMMMNILHYAGTDPVERKKIEDEREAWRTIQSMFQEYDNQLEKLSDAERKIEEKDKTIEEKDKTIEEKDKTIEDARQRLLRAALIMFKGGVAIETIVQATGITKEEMERF